MGELAKFFGIEPLQEPDKMYVKPQPYALE